MSAQKFLLLRADIDRALEQIAAVVMEGGETLEKLDGSPTTLELRGIGSILHDFYTGIEQLLEHIASELDGEIPGRGRLARAALGSDDKRNRVGAPRRPQLRPR